jgi:hypothetical protein
MAPEMKKLLFKIMFLTAGFSRWKAEDFSWRLGALHGRMRIRITLMRIRIRDPKMMRIHADPDPKHWRQ